jgi:hypothetical protein
MQPIRFNLFQRRATSIFAFAIGPAGECAPLLSYRPCKFLIVADNHSCLPINSLSISSPRLCASAPLSAEALAKEGLRQKNATPFPGCNP